MVDGQKQRSGNRCEIPLIRLGLEKTIIIKLSLISNLVTQKTIFMNKEIKYWLNFFFVWNTRPDMFRAIHDPARALSDLQSKVSNQKK